MEYGALVRESSVVRIGVIHPGILLLKWGRRKPPMQETGGDEENSDSLIKWLPEGLQD